MKVALRADASVAIGTGHAMRMLALAQGLSDAGHQPVFALAEWTDSVWAQLSGAADIVRIAAPSGTTADAAALVGLGADWVILDGYRFRGDYLRAVAAAARRVLVVDDTGLPGPYPCDLIVNPNPSADPAWYIQRADRTGLLLGLRYAMLRREFRRGCGGTTAAQGEATPRIVVTMGGSDPNDATTRICRALAASPRPFVADVLVGGSNPRIAQLQTLANDARFRVHHDVADVVRVFCAADLVVTAGGGTLWECGALGVPAAAVVTVDNQRPGVQAATAAGAVHHLGDIDGSDAAALATDILELAADVDRRREISRRLHAMVDGNGVPRIVAALGTERVFVRPVRADDLERTFAWANDPATRSASFHSGQISRAEHQAWLTQRLGDPCSRMYIGLDAQNREIGLVRFALEGTGAVVSVNVAPAMRGAGLGTHLIRAGTMRLLAELDVADVIAWIKPANLPSQAAFRRAGYRPDGRSDTIHGETADRWIFRASDLEGWANE